MKFVCNEDYCCVDGLTFLFKNPVTVDNKGTIERLLKDNRFKKYESVIQDQKQEEQINRHQCEKCAKIIARGLFIHKKYCKGLT